MHRAAQFGKRAEKRLEHAGEILPVRRTQLALFLSLLLVSLCAPPVRAQVSSYGDKSAGTENVLPTVLNKVGVEQNLNHPLPLSLPFVDETGRAVQLGEYFGKRPVVLALVYYQCPMLCSEELNGLTSALMMVRFDVGKDFDVLVISIDPSEGPEIAAAKKTLYVKRYGRPATAPGWHFLTGQQPAIDAITNAVGFHYAKVPGPDGRLTQFAHTSAIEIVTPQGKLAQYFYGVEYSPKDIRFALIQASDNKIGSPVEALVLYCYHYDPHTGKYSAIIARVVQLACLMTVFCLGGFMLLMFRRDARLGRISGTHPKSIG